MSILQTLKEKTASVSPGSYVPGMIVIGIICLTRSLGFLQGLEWWTFDTFLRLRPAASIDERVVVITIEEEDFQRYGNSIPDQALAELLQTLGQSSLKNLKSGSDRHLIFWVLEKEAD